MEKSKFYQIKNITEHEYTLVGCDGSVITRPIQDVDKSASAFTIQDAKDGDVIVYGDNPDDYHIEVIMLFKAQRNEYSAETYFHIFDNNYRVNDWCDCGKSTHPATKEQRDTLFVKMKEAGYEWNAEKKELKKIEQKSQRMVSAEAKEALYDKPSWSEDDELRLNTICNLLEDLPQQQNWLKSLKDRVISQPKQEWSKEDETKMRAALAFIKSEFPKKGDEEIMEDTIEWLKSLKQRIGWKPSAGQMKALHDLNLTGNISYAGQGQVLIELYNDLKKLIE